jgi:hypothetical protein
VLNALHVVRTGGGDGFPAPEAPRGSRRTDPPRLNLPRRTAAGLVEIKSDENLKTIPVVVLSVSRAEEDIVNIYSHCGNCYISKPVDLDQFTKVVRSIEDFWFTVVALPSTSQ